MTRRGEPELPARNNSLRQLTIIMNLINSDGFMQFIGQYFAQSPKSKQFLHRSTNFSTVTNLVINNLSQIHQIVPGLRHAFQFVEDLTLSNCRFALVAPALDFRPLNLTMLHIDINGLRDNDDVVNVQTDTRRAIYVRDPLAEENSDGRFADRFIAANQVPVGVYTLQIFVDGLDYLHLFNTTNRNYHQYFRTNLNI
ncbi:hypothetical protein MBANPS3_010301 [Mucor bainieri]